MYSTFEFSFVLFMFCFFVIYYLIVSSETISVFHLSRVKRTVKQWWGDWLFYRTADTAAARALGSLKFLLLFSFPMKMTYVIFFTFLLHTISYKVYNTSVCVWAGDGEENSIGMSIVAFFQLKLT